MATPYQSIDPALLALQTAKKAMPASPNTQQKKKPVLQSNIQQSQAPFATSSVTPTKIGGISSPFGAPNINSSPVLGGATPQDIKETTTQLQSLPKAMPDTGATPPDMTQSLKDLKASIPSMQSIDDIKGAFPEFSNLDDSVLLDLVETTKNSDNYEDILGVFPELQGKKDGNFITDLGSGIGQSVTGFGNLGKKLAFGAVDLYRQSQGKEKLTPEQRASAEQTPMGQALNTITNWQTPEEKASIGGQIGMVAGSVAQGAALGTPLTSAIGKIPGAAQIATKAPILSKIAGGIGQGLEGQLQYSATAEGKLPTSKELFTAGAFGGAVNAIGPIAKGIKDMKKPTAPFKETRNKIAEGIVGSNLKNPAMREKYISKVGQTPEKTLLDEGITGSLGNQATQVANKSKQAYDATRVALKSIPTQFKSDEGLWITNKILEGVDTSIPGIEDVIAPIKDMNTRFANGSASAIDMNDAKLLLARYEGLYDDFGRVKKTGDEFEKKALAKMYDNMKTEIENVGEQYGMDIKSMNKETQKREGLRGLMDRAVSREAGRDMISLSDYMLGGITIVDPMTAIPLTLGKKFFSSPKVTSKIAKLLYSKGDDVITNSTNNASMNVANGATKQGLKYPIKLQQEGMQVGGATLPKPTPKTPPITIEKGAIGMGTPKVNNTPVIPPKATVAPSVGAPKVDNSNMPLIEKQKILTDYLDKHNKARESYIKSVYEQYDGDIAKSYIKDWDNKFGPKAVQARKALGTSKSRASANEVSAKKFMEGLSEGKPVSPKTKIDDTLLQEAKKYKTADEFMNGKAYTDYGFLLKEGDSIKYRTTNGVFTAKIESIKNTLHTDNSYVNSDSQNIIADFGNGTKKNISSTDHIAEINGKPHEGGYKRKTFADFKQIRVQANKKPLPAKGLPKLGKETLEQVGESIKEFGDFKDVDVNNKNEVFSRFASEGDKQKLSSGISRNTADKMSMLDTQLRRYGHKGVKNTDFGSMYKLLDIYDNTEFFTKYPSLKDTNVIFADFHTPTKRGMAVGSDIYINSKLYNKDPELLRSTIVHEIQHMKQDIRGMVGRNSEMDERILSKQYIEDPREIDAKRKQDAYLQFAKSKKPLPPLPKKGLPKLGKEIMEQNIAKTDNLISEAKKYNSADEFISKVKEKRIEGQRGWTAPSGYGEPLKDRISYDGDVTLREELTKHIKQPDDYFHGYLGPKKYGNDSATITAAKKGLADGEITIYRSVNKGIDTWRDGDWVYLVKDKAAKHGENALGGDYNILEKKVSIDDVWRDGNDINEWGYDSGKEAQNLKQIREQANKKPLPPLPKKGK